MRILLGTLVGIVALWFVFRGESLSGLSDAIRQADPLWSAAALASVGVRGDL
jgi:hypothetical protein